MSTHKIQGKGRGEPPAQGQASSQSSNRKWLFGLVAIALGGLFAMALVEVALRISIPESDIHAFIYVPGSLRQKIMRPNLRGQVYRVPFETNDSGYRAQRSYVQPKRPDGRRIIVLGDSFTVSGGVPFEQLATTRLEALSNEAFPAARAEVFNLGVGGHQIVHHLATLKEVGLGYNPDLILLFLYPPNDFDPESYDRERAFLDEHADAQGPIVQQVEGDFLHSLYVARAFGALAAGVARKIDFIHRMMGPSSYEEMLQIFEQRAAPWQRSVAALREIGRIAREAELPVYAFLLPATFQTYEAQRPVYEGAEAAVREAGLPVYSLLPDFAATGQAPQHFQINLIDGHPNADYNVLAAGKIFEELRRSGEMERLIENTDGYYMSHDMPPEREHDR